MDAMAMIAMLFVSLVKLLGGLLLQLFGRLGVFLSVHGVLRVGGGVVGASGRLATRRKAAGGGQRVGRVGRLLLQRVRVLGVFVCFHGGTGVRVLVQNFGVVCATDLRAVKSKVEVENRWWSALLGRDGAERRVWGKTYTSSHERSTTSRGDGRSGHTKRGERGSKERHCDVLYGLGETVLAMMMVVMDEDERDLQQRDHRIDQVGARFEAVLHGKLLPQLVVLMRVRRLIAVLLIRLPRLTSQEKEGSPDGSWLARLETGIATSISVTSPRASTVESLHNPCTLNVQRPFPFFFFFFRDSI